MFAFQLALLCCIQLQVLPVRLRQLQAGEEIPRLHEVDDAGLLPRQRQLRRLDLGATRLGRGGFLQRRAGDEAALLLAARVVVLVLELGEELHSLG